MKTLVLMIAPPGVETSNLVMKLAKKHLFSDVSIIVSTDEIRKRLLGNETYERETRKVFEIAFNAVEEALVFSDDVCVFVDACNYTGPDRRKFTRFAIANPVTKIVGVLYDGIPEDVSLRFYDMIPRNAHQLLYESPEFDAVIPFSVAEEMTRKEI